MSLRNDIVRLAKEHKHLQPYLLPLLRKTAGAGGRWAEIKQYDRVPWLLLTTTFHDPIVVASELEAALLKDTRDSQRILQGIRQAGIEVDPKPMQIRGSSTSVEVVAQMKLPSLQKEEIEDREALSKLVKKIWGKKLQVLLF